MARLIHAAWWQLRDVGLLRRMLAFVVPYARYMALSLVLVLAAVLCANLMPVVVKQAIDGFLLPGASASGLRGVARAALAFLALALVTHGLRFGQSFLLAWVGLRVISDLRDAVFAKLLRLHFGYYDRHPVGRMMTRVTSDVAAMQKALTDGAVSLVADLVALAGIMGFMLYVNARLALVIFLVMPLLFLVIAFLNARIRGAHRAVRQEQSNLNTFLQEMITGMLTIQLFSRERDALARFDHANGALRDACIRSIYWFSYFFPSMEVMGALTTVLLLCAGGFMLLQGVPGVTAGVLVAFLMYIRELFRPMEDLSEKSNNLQSAFASAERIFELLDTPEAVADPADPEAIEGFRGEVEFDGVSFAYDAEDWVLRNVSFRIAPAESLAIVGATGAGKTSMASLLARFYDVQKGAIRVDGHDVRRLRQEELRRRIGIVLQDPFVFSGTVAENIGLHNPALTRAQVEQAARYVNADGFIRRMRDGYDTVLHERGAALSTGQKQLLALARALAQNPDILLILDEATANVDTETEQLIQDALEKLMHGRTSIIIAHRLSTIRHVDRILVMRHGEIVEQGGHEDLVQRDGYYRSLYELLFRTAS